MWIISLFLVRLINVHNVHAESLLSKPKIIGGYSVSPGERPFQVSLQAPSHFCGGSIIDTNYVVTAAHCLRGKKASDIKIFAGSIDLKRTYKIYQASKIVIHENYDPETSYHNDIGLIQVTPSFTFDSSIQPIALSTNDDISANTPAVTSGWGGLYLGSPIPNTLQEVTVTIDSPQHCMSVLQDIIDTQICTTNYDAKEEVNPRKGVCPGDSGGPLTVGKTLVGITSYIVSDGECGSEFPDVYTRVSKFADWIQKHK